MLVTIQLIQIFLLGIMYGVYSYQAISNSKFSIFLRKHGIDIIFVCIMIILLLSLTMFLI